MIYQPIIYFIGLMFIAGIVPLKTSAQTADSANLLQEESTLTIKGSSTLHDWDVEASEYSVIWQIPENWFATAGNWRDEDIEQLEVSVSVNSLDGGRNKMNRDLREALNAEKYEEIRFSWRTFAFREIRDSTATADISGVVEISGNSRDVDFHSEITLSEERRIAAEGVGELDMEEFGIEPPRALLGMIRTDPEVELHFKLQFESASN
ncbi:MAG: YceI family protein [Bacteroidota bacterium]